jgi:hypothetical protein
MRAIVSLLALGCVGASLLPSSQELSIALVVAAITLAGSAVGTYLFGELRMPKPVRTKGPANMRKFSRRIPVEYVDPARRTNDRDRREAHSI